MRATFNEGVTGYIAKVVSRVTNTVRTLLVS